MKVSLAALKTTLDPHIRSVVVALLNNDARRNIGPEPTDMVDNSTGTAGASLVAIPTADKFVYTSGSTLAPRAAFNTAIGKIDDAIAVIGTYLSVQTVKLGLGAITLNATGAVAVAGTVPAQDKSLTATDGSSNTALLRSQANASITVHRNNLATLVRAYNQIATAIGVDTLLDATGGKPTLTSLVLSDEVTATTAAGNTADVVSDAAIDAILLAFANNIATLVAKINGTLFPASAILPRQITLVQ